MEEIHLGGGCFWCIEGGLLGLRGVEEVVPGYSGGHVENPTYEQVCGKKTGHAEVVRVKFDPERIPRMTLLRVFHTLFDPTQLNRQGNDIGPQYRSIVLYSGDAQKRDALAAIEEVSDYYDEPVVTEVVPLDVFWQAEDYHHDYYARNGSTNPYCVAVVAPKIAKTRALHADLYE
ncbi:MAG: peptide-methionine (S)-S-oxide reductase [Euryarchaeota archaeon]|nr:peptide-methionine (S)-S-oxide reductase [Euryarchaeota archaeon]